MAELAIQPTPPKKSTETSSEETVETDEEDHSNEQNVLLKSAITEDALGDPDEIDHETRTTFWELQTELNKVSSLLPTYQAACQRLNLDPVKPVVDGVQLFPWQVTGVAWMSQMEGTLLQGGLNADDTGVGKTLTSLAFILACGSDEPPGKLIRAIPKQTWPPTFPDMIEIEETLRKNAPPAKDENSGAEDDSAADDPTGSDPEKKPRKKKRATKKKDKKPEPEDPRIAEGE